MLLASLQRTELRHYFAIKKDLVKAVRDGDAGQTEHHIDELQILAMHTQSSRLRVACNATVAEQGPLLPRAAHA